MKKSFLPVFVFFVCVTALFAQDAASIVDASLNRIKASTVLTQSRMVISAKNGSATERAINQYSKDDKDGNERVIIEFLSPASVKGTRFLTMNKSDGGKDQWIFLPSLNRVRRIASSEGSGSFMGTDLSYDDIASTSRKAGEDTHKILREEIYNDNDCYVIESVPKDKSYQYSKMNLWIDKKNSVTHKMELFDKSGKLVKVFEIKKLQDVQGRFTPMESTMTNTASGTSTTIFVQKIQYDGNIPEGAFTTRYLETGKTN
jgi:hypothetical protein